MKGDLAEFFANDPEGMAWAVRMTQIHERVCAHLTATVPGYASHVLRGAGRVLIIMDDLTTREVDLDWEGLSA